MTGLRPKDEPWPGGRGVYDWTISAFRPVYAIQSAGEALDVRAHREIVPGRTGSSAESCALHGGGRGAVTRRKAVQE